MESQKIESEIDKILKKLTSTISLSSKFPDYIVLDKRVSHFFFDSDWIADEEFIKTIINILILEGSESCCIAELDALQKANKCFSINKDTQSSKYIPYLNTGNDCLDYMYSIGRFGCISEVGEWCIYCERRDEIGVISFTNRLIAEKYANEISYFKASGIKQAIEQEISYGFSSRALSNEWKKELVRVYE